MSSPQDASEQVNWHWRNTMRPLRFFGMDSRAALPYLILLPYARPITLVFCILSTVLFMVLEKHGLTLPAAVRSLRSSLVGERRFALARIRRRKLRDFG
jgi:intracellular multiplication protein IcmT|tara:strand:- start:282 stop:578 length:297 start_codon:yes stop_codon:yes gene_type:complete